MSSSAQTHENGVEQSSPAPHQLIGDVKVKAEANVQASQDAIANDQALRRRVKGKENGLAVALQKLKSMREQVAGARVSTPDIDLESWVSLSNDIEKDHQSFEFRVGTMGDTGVGKSSLLNCLVGGVDDITPQSQHRACTASICCFHYRKSTNPSTKYMATIYFKSKEAIDQEISAFFAEYREFEQRARREGSFDSTVHAERKRLNEKLSHVSSWSGIEVERLQEMINNEQMGSIVNHCKHASKYFIMGKPQERRSLRINRPTPKAFLQAIKPYVGSSNQKDGIAWPLVDIVHIYIEAEILLHGVVLVDLPGEMDALETRSEVARKYCHQLDLLMVVSPSDRAADNRTAIELIREDRILDMEADGSIHNDSLCVIATKADLMDWEAFVENEWAPEDVSPQFPHMLSQLTNKRAETERIIDSIDELKDELGEVEDEYDTDGEMSGPDERSQESQQTQPSQLDQLRMQRRALRQDVAKLEAMCHRACIDARSQDIIRVFQDYFDEIRNSARATDVSKVSTKLSVFPVSSQAYRQLKKGNPIPAFRDEAATGIQALQEWILKGSLPSREHHADIMLQRCLTLFDAIQGWLMNEEEVPLKLPQSQLVVIKAALEKEKEVLKGHFKKVWANFANHVRNLPSNRLKELEAKNKGISNDLAGNFVRHVEKYAEASSKTKLHWSTYAACIRRNGGLFRTYTKKTICWQSSIYTFFWSPQAVKWSDSFNEKLPRYAAGVSRKCAGIVGGHLWSVRHELGLPDEFVAAFTKDAYRIENLASEQRVQINQALKTYLAAIKAIRNNAKELLTIKMAPGFGKANSDTGKGKYERQRNILKNYAEEIRFDIFAEVCAEFSAQLCNARNDFNKLCQKCGDDFLSKVYNEEYRIAKRVCSSGKTLSPKSKTDMAVQSLKTALVVETTAWFEYWKVLKLEFPAIKVEPLDEAYLEAPLDMRDGKGTRSARAKTKKESGEDGSLPLPSLPAKKAKVPRKRKLNADGTPSETPLKKPKAKANTPKDTTTPKSTDKVTKVPIVPKASKGPKARPQGRPRLQSLQEPPVFDLGQELPKKDSAGTTGSVE